METHEMMKKEWSTLMGEDSNAFRGVGTWKVRFMPQDKDSRVKWKKPQKKELIHQKTDAEENPIPKTQLTVQGSYRTFSAKPTYSTIDENKTPRNKLDFANEMTYDNWLGDSIEHEAFSSSNFSQPTWQLPVSKLNASDPKKEKFTVFPLSFLHKIWKNVNQVRRIDELGNSNFKIENFTISRMDHEIDPYCKDEECFDQNLGDSTLMKGDLDTAEGAQARGGMGGGQPVLLIKGDDKGGSNAGQMSGPWNSDNVLPMAIMMTPVVMMCVMMPMMMNLMSGMANSMKTMTSIMWMIALNANGSASVTTSTKKSDEEQKREHEIFTSFITEFSERFEDAVNKYEQEI